MAPANRFFAQSAEMGALPTLYAATVPGFEGGAYIGPDGFAEIAGIQRVHPTGRLATRRWRGAYGPCPEQLTGVKVEPVASV